MDQQHGQFDPGGAREIPETAIAIVGMSCRFAGARGVDEYWNLLRDGREAVRTYTDEELAAEGVSPALLRDRNYVRRGAPLDDMECFDASLFDLSPRDAAIMDPQHRHFLECTWEALENAGHTPQRFDGVIGVFGGTGHNAYMPYNLLTNPKLVRDVGLFLLRHTSNDKDFLTTRVSYLFDLKGPSINVQTACSTSLVAIHMAAQSLLNGECDMAIAGGSSIELPHRLGYVYEEGEILSPDGHCRPFDAASQGTVFGSGVAVVALRRLADAVEAGDHIYAVLRGSAVNNDGAGKVGYLAPSVDGQAKAIAEALAMAEVDAGSIAYVEAHGTGTPVGDPIELAALTQAFRQTTDSVGYCGIGSVKASIGHTDTAAGAAGLIKVALSLHHEELPASLNFDAPNPAIAFEGSPFRVQQAHAPWPAGSQPRRAGISSLGVGGTNAHVVLEEAPPRPPSGPSRRRYQLLLCTAKSAAVAEANAGALASFLQDNPAASLADTAFTLAIGRQHLLHRRFVVADGAGQAAERLRALGGQDAAAQAYLPERPVAFMFCGAGPQHADMARDLYQNEPLFRAEVDRALATLDRLGPNEVRRWLFPSEADWSSATTEMERPSVALPALFVIQTALARLWMSVGVQPSAMIGHSSGEYAAAHLAGVIDLESGLRIVSARGRLFETIRDGGMLSVPLSEAELLPLLPADLSIAAINAPGLCVVSGPAKAVARFHEELAGREIETQVVRISVAAHSPMLDPILPEFRALMQTIDLRAPQIPFVSNLTGDWATGADVTDPEYWVRHLRQTVRFTDGLGRLLEDQDRALLEVGPGRGMASLARQHPGRGKQQPVLSSMRHPDQDADDDAVWLEALGQLWAAGVQVDWDSYWKGEQRLRIPLPTYQFDRQRHWYEPGAQLAMGQGAARGGDRSDDIADWQYEPVWKRTFPPAGDARQGLALIFDDGCGLGRQIADRLEADAVTVRAGHRFARLGQDLFSVNPASQVDYRLLFDALAAEGRLPSQIYHGWLITGDGRKQPSAEMLLERGFHSLVAMSRELAGQVGGERVDIALLTDRVQRIADDRDLMPVKATALGAASVISTEYPNLNIRCIDVSLPSQDPPRAVMALADAVVSELAEDSNESVVAYRGGERWVREFSQIPAGMTGRKASEPHPRSDATYLVTGGLGGLGLAVARQLAETPGVRIALLGRTALPPREDWAGLLASRSIDAALESRLRKVLTLEACGARVEIIAADVANPRAMQKAVRQITARLGPINGVFHTAGVLDDELVESKSRAGMDAVLKPKVAGTLALEQALKDQPPEFIMLFSSISAFAGLPGQVDYAAANAFLDSYAQARAADGKTRVASVGWSPWREVGMAAQLSEGGETAGLAVELPDSGSIDHPFLEKLHLISPDEAVVSSTLSPEQHWLLAEHRMAGTGPLIPGTGFLELVRAAHSLVSPGMMTLSDVTFLTPFAVPDGEARDLRIHFKRRAGEDWRFAILGRPAGADAQDWVEHVTGVVSAMPMLAVPDRLEVEAAERRCAKVLNGKEVSSSALQFGPRWSNVQRTALGEDEAVLRLSLGAAFHGDLEHVQLHPALLDFATAGAQSLIPGYNAGKDLFAPFSYRRLVLHAPLSPSIVSHIRRRSCGTRSDLMAVFDVTIADVDGRVLAEISEFTMMRVGDGGLPKAGSERVIASSNRASQAAVDDRGAILPEEGLQVIANMLEGSARPHVVIAPSDLTETLARLRAPHQAVRRESTSDAEGGGDLPATAMEQVIADLWTELLGVDPIYRDDNFFDLGGHSLLAVQFTNRLRKKTGKTLPLAALLDTPTVASLARELDPEGAERAQASGGEEAQAAAAPRDIVTVRAGGGDTPVFFVHDGLGETLLYRGLALRLDGNRTVYGIEPLRNPSGGYAHTRIDEMAANYVERMRAVQPHGPYLLAGLCAGGVIAFEMARQLQDAGETAAFVGIIDAADVDAAKRPFHITRTRLDRIKALLGDESMVTLVSALARKTANAVRWEIESRIAMARDRQTIQQLRTANEAANARPEAAAAEPSIPFLKLYEVAHTLHRPHGLFSGGKVALFKASKGNGDGDDMAYQDIYSDLALGWGKRVADEISLISVSGGHTSALQEPHVATLAPLFQQALDAATSPAEMPLLAPPVLQDQEMVAAE